MTDTNNSPSDVVTTFLKAFEAMDFDTALTYLADDCEYTNIPMSTVHGHEGCAACSDHSSKRSTKTSS